MHIYTLEALSGYNLKAGPAPAGLCSWSVVTRGCSYSSILSIKVQWNVEDK